MFLTDPSIANRKCPECGTDRICRDRRSDGFERVLSLLNVYPYYCLQCPTNVRFYRTGRK